MRVCPICQTTMGTSEGLCPEHGLALIPKALLDHLKEAPLLGHVVDKRYVLTDLVGIGGMGVVYLGRQRPLDRTVAVKVLDRVFTSTPMARKRFEREARSICNLRSHNTVTLYDYGVVEHTGSGELAFMVMEYVDGGDLATRLQTGAIPLPQVRLILEHITRSLTEAHLQGILHRDIKPSNILMTREPDGRPLVKLIDFGVAQVQGALAGQGTDDVSGTPHYMAPEITEAGRSPDIRADVYAVGVVLYEMITGKRPFVGETALSLIVQHRTAKVPYLPGYKTDPAERALNPVIQRAMAKDPDARFPTVQALYEAVELAMRRAGVPDLKAPLVDEDVTRINLPPRGAADTYPGLNDSLGSERVVMAPLMGPDGVPIADQDPMGRTLLEPPPEIDGFDHNSLNASASESASGSIDGPSTSGSLSGASSDRSSGDTREAVQGGQGPADGFDILPPETVDPEDMTQLMVHAPGEVHPEDATFIGPPDGEPVLVSPYRRTMLGLAGLSAVLAVVLFVMLREVRNPAQSPDATATGQQTPGTPPGATTAQASNPGGEASPPSDAGVAPPDAAPAPDARVIPDAAPAKPDAAIEVARPDPPPGRRARRRSGRRNPARSPQRNPAKALADSARQAADADRCPQAWRKAGRLLQEHPSEKALYSDLIRDLKASCLKRRPKEL